MLFLLVLALYPKLGLDQYENGEYSCTYKFLLNKESLYILIKHMSPVVSSNNLSESQNFQKKIGP